jgi:hypothetical protein
MGVHPSVLTGSIQGMAQRPLPCNYNVIQLICALHAQTRVQLQPGMPNQQLRGEISTLCLTRGSGIVRFLSLVIDETNLALGDDRRAGDRQPGYYNRSPVVSFDFQAAAQLPEPLSHSPDSNSRRAS